MACGIYRIRNRVSGRTYIGSALKIEARWSAHRWHLSRGHHHSQPLQRAWIKYGAEAFVFEIVELVEPIKEHLLSREQFWMDIGCPAGLYNTCHLARSIQGVRRSAETRAKLSAANTGKKCSAATKAKLSDALKGRAQWPNGRPAEVIAKIAAALRGGKRSDEAKAKMSAAKLGKRFGPCSEQRKAAISAANRGRRLSAETCTKIAERRAHQIIPPHTLEARAKISATLMGHAVSEETRRKISATKALRRAAALKGVSYEDVSMGERTRRRRRAG